MKLTRILGWTCPFGRVEFVPANPGYKVFWRPDGKTSFGRVGWIDSQPTANIARFFIRREVALARGLCAYTYADANIDPPCNPN